MIFSITESKFSIENFDFKRLYFHSPISFIEVIEKYGSKMLGLHDVLSLKRKYPDIIELDTWNLLIDSFSEFQDSRCKMNDEVLNLTIDKNSDLSLYLGIQPLHSEKRCCLFSDNIVFIDPRPDWTTFGFGIIVSDELKKSPISSKNTPIAFSKIEIINQ